MPVTYTNPIVRPDATGGRVVEMWIDHEERRAFLRYAHRDAAGRTTLEQVFRFGDRSEDQFPYTQFLTALPTLTTVRTDAESGLIDAGLVPAGVIE